MTHRGVADRKSSLLGLTACGGMKWYAFSSLVWLFYLCGVECNEIVYTQNGWNGCGDNDVRHQDICFTMKSPMDGISAFRAYSLDNKWLEWNDTWTQSASLMESIEKMAENVGTSEGYIWVPRIDTLKKVHEKVDIERICPSMEFFNGFKYRELNCDKELPVLYYYKQYKGVIYNAEAEEACNIQTAVAVTPLHGCYVKENECRGKSIMLRLDPSMIPYGTTDITRIVDNVQKGREIYIEILDVDAGNETNRRSNSPTLLIPVFQPPVDDDTELDDEREDIASGEDEKQIRPEHLSTTAKFCFKGNGSTNHTKIRLELRHNRTAGGLSLWVGSPGRVAWPPTCSYAHLIDPMADPRALQYNAIGEYVVSCLAQDIVDGSMVVSNRILFNGKNIEDCPDTNSNAGPPPGTVTDRKSSCLRCLKYALSQCPNHDCTPECYQDDRGCGHYRITLSEWAHAQQHGESFEGFKACAMDETCAAQALWLLTEGVDINGDGVFDCDDRLAKALRTREDPRETQEGVKYWKCRSGPRADFVDVFDGNRTARFYCMTGFIKRKFWSSPEYLDKITTSIETSSAAYVQPLLSSNSPTTSKLVKAISQDEAINTLETLTVQSRSNVTISVEEMDVIADSVSKLLEVGEETILRAQGRANVPSIAEMLETLLIHTPMDLSCTRTNLAISKGGRAGFQLLSDAPTGKGDVFGVSPRQLPAETISDIRTNQNQVEAAVVLSDLPQDLILVAVAYAKSEDFVPCRPPMNLIGTSKSTMAAASNDENEFANLLESEEYCPEEEEFVRGCVNSYIMQVGLLGNSGSYQQLPDGIYVDVIARTRTSSMMGQTKRCAYWDTKNKGWATDGCELQEQANGLDTCRCTHLSHFAQLVTDGSAVTGSHAAALRIMTICACVISLLALAGILSAGAFARKWRSKKENKVMVNLAMALSVFMILFLWSSAVSKPALDVGRCQDTKPSMACHIRGVILHYSVLSSFCWMLVAAASHYMRFTTFTGPSGVTRFSLKASLVGWGVPLLPVVGLVMVDAETYAGRGRDFCYPTGAAFYGAVLAPILLVLLINLAIFILILRRLFPHCCVSKDAGTPRRPGYNQRREQLRKMIVCVAFTFLFGLTWYLGLMAFTVVPAYIFCVVMALQGPALFVFFVLGEESIRSKLMSIRRGFKQPASEQYRSTASTDTPVSGPQSSETMPLSSNVTSDPTTNTDIPIEDRASQQEQQQSSETMPLSSNVTSDPTTNTYIPLEDTASQHGEQQSSESMSLSSNVTSDCTTNTYIHLEDTDSQQRQQQPYNNTSLTYRTSVRILRADR